MQKLLTRRTPPAGYDYPKMTESLVRLETWRSGIYHAISDYYANPSGPPARYPTLRATFFEQNYVNAVMEFLSQVLA